MSGKKTELIGFRLSPEEKKEAERICSDLGQAPGSLAGILFERFIKQRKTHGTRLIWPPEFNYYPTGAQSIQEATDIKSDLANESSRQKAG